MGAELEDDQANYFQSSLVSNGTFTSGPDPNSSTGFATGNGTAQLLLGVLDGGVTGTTYNPAVAIHYFGGYLQDDWRPTPKLTLNLGMRYEIQTAPTYRHNVASVFNPMPRTRLAQQLGSRCQVPSNSFLITSAAPTTRTIKIGRPALDSPIRPCQML